MSRFKAPPALPAGLVPATNLAGGAAFERDPKAALASLAMTSMLRGDFYRTADAEVAEIRALCIQLAAIGELEFVAKAALYARHTGNLRSVSHLIAAEVAHLRGAFPAQRMQWGPRFFDRIVLRPDDAGEIAAAWIQLHGGTKIVGPGSRHGHGTLPASMKRGFARALARFNAQALAKWDRKGGVTLRQLAHMVHPKGAKPVVDPETNNLVSDSAIFSLRAGTLPPAETFEVKLSAAGKAEGGEEAVAEAKATAWADLFAVGKVKYLAALRNCRNILTQAPEVVPQLCALLRSERDVRASRVFPFQFLTAHQEIEALSLADMPAAKNRGIAESRAEREALIREVLAAIEDGAELACACKYAPEGATLIALDTSGSMVSATTASGMRAADYGVLLAAALEKSSKDCDMVLFSTETRVMRTGGRDTIWSRARQLKGAFMGGGTDFGSVFRSLCRAYDRIVFLTDEQSWVGGGAVGLRQAQRFAAERCGKAPFVYSWNLVGSSTSQFAPGYCLLAGLNDNVFDLMKRAEQDPKVLVHAIEALEI